MPNLLRCYRAAFIAGWLVGWFGSVASAQPERMGWMRSRGALRTGILIALPDKHDEPRWEE